ncbi:MAG: DUF5605 domain-containing protein [Clostridia bacterium]|nr:DUF5605 domain-containing protein [Clostridia bacterium]
MSDTWKSIERWAVEDLVFQGPRSGNPFTEVEIAADFTHGNRTLHVPGFYDGEGRYVVRFSPDTTGEWNWTTVSNRPELDGRTGSFTCTPAAAGNHGPVRIAGGTRFAYEDGTPYHPFGTTCYAWTHQGDALEERTLRTLASSPFNKIRMCVFPKHYTFNTGEPPMHPFEGSLEAGWDFTRFRPDFFQHLEGRIGELSALGIEADLILFHPYDRWGYADMGAEADDRYLRYIVARLAAYRNVWWSFANEYDLLRSKTTADWERMAALVSERDPWQRLRSIHNCFGMYDHTRPWITHCSIQRTDWYKTAEHVDEWIARFRKPVVVDECAYEGDIPNNWGNISAEEMVRRFWEGTLRGGYVGHGETYWNPEEVLWWSKGGDLHGGSPARIAFLRGIAEADFTEGMVYSSDGSASDRNPPYFGRRGVYYLHYFGFNQPSWKVFAMPAGERYRVDVIDTWAMTVTPAEGEFEGTFRVALPGRPYMAIRLRRI